MLKTNTAIDGTLISRLKPNSEKRVELICNDCGKETSTSFANYTRAVKPDGSTNCKKCAMVKAGLAKRGKPIKGGNRPKVWGDKHSSWKGGRFIASDGYVHIHLGSPRKYRKEHFLVIEESIGRPLTSKEVIHHIDGDKQNNRIDNLVLLENESAHRKLHMSLYGLSALLIKRGLIECDRQSLSYVAVGKLRELLEQPEEVNQQPSSGGDPFEGSTTRCKSQVDNNASTSAGRVSSTDDIV